MADYPTAEDSDYSCEAPEQPNTWNQQAWENAQVQGPTATPTWPSSQALDETQPCNILNYDNTVARRPTSHPHPDFFDPPLAISAFTTGTAYDTRLNNQDLHGQHVWNPTAGYGWTHSTLDLEGHPILLYPATQTYSPFQPYRHPDPLFPAPEDAPATVPSTPQQVASGIPWHPLRASPHNPQGAVHFRARTAGNDVVVTTTSTDAQTEHDNTAHAPSYQSEPGSSDLPHSRCKICNNVVSKAARESDRKSNVTRHIRNHHRGLAKPTCNEPGCGGRAFARQDLLLRHQRSNHGTMPPHRVSRRGSRTSRGQRVPRRRTSY